MRVVRVERTRPVVAEGTGIDELADPVVAHSRQEETVAVESGEKHSFHAVPSRPCIGGIVLQFFPLLLARRAPAAAPIGRRWVVTSLQRGQVIRKAIVALVGLVAVLGQLFRFTVDVLVGIPIVSRLRLGFAPSEIIAITFGRGGTHVAGGPQRAAWQAKVNIVMILVGLGIHTFCGKKNRCH